MPVLCLDGAHVWFYPNAEDFCTVCGLHQMDRKDAERLDAELEDRKPPGRLRWVPESH